MIDLDNSRALILAGGRGERLRPATDTYPKPLLKILNKPMIKYVIDSLESNGINKITIGVKYKAEQIISEIGNKYDYILEGSTMAEQVFLTAKSFSESVLLGFSADTLITKRSIEQIIYIHDKEKFDATLLLTTLPRPQQKKWEFIIKHEILEELKVQPTYTNYERVGLALNRDVLSSITNQFTDYMAKELESYHNYEQYQKGWNFILKRLLDCGFKVQAHLTDHPVYNINTQEAYDNAEKFINKHL